MFPTLSRCGDNSNLIIYLESNGRSSIPFTWDLTKMVAGYAEVKLNPQTDAAEYTDVSNAFLQSSGGGIKINEVLLYNRVDKNGTDLFTIAKLSSQKIRCNCSWMQHPSCSHSLEGSTLISARFIFHHSTKKLMIRDTCDNE